MADIRKITGYLGKIEDAVRLLEQENSGEADLSGLIRDILVAQREVNRELFFTESFSSLVHHEDYLEQALRDKDRFLQDVLEWFGLVVEALNESQKHGTSMDGDFYSFMKYISVSEVDDIVADIKYHVERLDPDWKKAICTYFNMYSYFWGSLIPEDDIYEVAYDRASVLKEHEKEFIWLYNRLEDYRSKNVLFCLLRNWISLSGEELVKMYETNFPDYFDLDILSCGRDEVVVDCGAFDGDSAMSFINTYRRYKRIYCYEASAANFRQLENNLSEYKDVVLKHLAVGEGSGQIMISDSEASSKVGEDGNYPVDMVSLDQDILEPITLIKLDVEGAEQDVIKGSESHIKNDRPKLLLSVYHGNHDIIEIPLMIESLREDYRYYLRFNGQGAVPSEIIFFAV